MVPVSGAQGDALNLGLNAPVTVSAATRILEENFAQAVGQLGQDSINRVSTLLRPPNQSYVLTASKMPSANVVTQTPKNRVFYSRNFRTAVGNERVGSNSNQIVAMGDRADFGLSGTGPNHRPRSLSPRSPQECAGLGLRDSSAKELGHTQRLLPHNYA